MNKKELMDLLIDVPDNTNIILASDPEGNNFRLCGAYSKDYMANEGAFEEKVFVLFPIYSDYEHVLDEETDEWKEPWGE